MMGAAILLGSILAAAAVSLPFAWVDRERKGPLFHASLAILFALTAFGAMIAGLAPDGFGAGILEVWCMLLAGAFIYSALEKLGPSAPLGRWIFAAAGALVVAAFVSMVWLDGRRWDSLAAGFWMGCNAGGLFMYGARGGRWRKASREARPVLLAALAFATVNLAQVVRVIMSGSEGQIVVLAAVPLVLAATAAAASRELALSFAGPGRRYEKSGLSDAAAQDLFGRIERLMAGKAFTDPGLDRDRLAALLGAEPRAVGEAVNRIGGASLAAYLRAQRLKEAERLLSDPANARTSLEAIGMLAGFHSRSRFYAAFEEAFGETPGARRERLRQG